MTLRTIAAAPDAEARLTVGQELPPHDLYTSHAATYTSGSLSISAVLHEPTAAGRHPGVILVHGFVDPATYTTGGELQREQDYLASLTVAAWKAAGKVAELVTLQGEAHVFEARWPDAMDAVTAFFTAHL